MQDMEQLYKEYFETIYKYLFCLTHDYDISEDLTQETFYKAVKKINTYKGECKISTWHKIAIINMMKKKIKKIDLE